MKIFVGKKKSQYYNGLLIKADLGLHEQIAQMILEKVPRGGKILDLGAGEGALSERLSDLGYQVVAADKDKESFKSSKAIFSQINFDSPEEINDFVDGNDGVFDAVLGVEVIEHVQDQWKYIRQLLRMAKPHGVILITTPNTSSWISRVMFLLTGRFHQFLDTDLYYGHINPISPWELGLILSESGAKNIEIKSAGTLPPVYITGSVKMVLINLFALILRPFSKGILDGWCVMAVARKPE
jgi:cyclopropane fatty-acyl-phospholipid synthase-like methyltransferase